MFKTRLGIVAMLLGLSFLVILGRLWQLQVTRYDKYAALAGRDQNMEKMVASLRGTIFDRNGEALAYDQPFYDLSIRTERLKLTRVKLEDVAAVREQFKDSKEERDAAFAALTEKLCAEPFVRDLAHTVDRDEHEVADGILKALDTVGRKWASEHTPLRIVSGIDEKTWHALRAVHDDVFRDSYKLLGKAADSLNDAQEPPFPGLVCTLSTRRVYPHGRLGCFVLGSVGEMSANDDAALREDGVLLEFAEVRHRQWQQIRDGLDENAASLLEPLVHGDPRELPLSQLFSTLANMRPSDQHQAAALGLNDVVRWTERAPRVSLVEPEMLWLGVGLPTSTAKNRLPNLIIGDMGAERVYNDRLRGKAGMKLRGDFESDDDDGKFRRNSEPHEGDALALTISIPWQTAVEKALKNQEHKGAIVVIDVKTGDILAMASNPDFDPNVFVPPRDNAERQEKINALLGDTENKPLLNRSVAQQYPLGSVMKTIIAAVALEKGLVNPNETIECKGFMVEGGQKFHCDDGRAHGIVNLAKGLRCSCNMYYMQVGARIGVENLGPFARQIFGRRSGIDLPSEAPGIYPDREWRLKHFPSDPAARIWPRGNDYQLAIGQGMMTCTVVQAAQLMAAVANNGTVVTPHIWLDAPPMPTRSLGISPGNLAIVREGLEEVVNVGTPGERGTAYTPFHELGPLSIKVAGKTSTAETRKDEKPHAWFAGYAPADNPQIAFAVLLEHAGHGGATAAPVAYQFLREMYGTKNNPKGRSVASGE
jgi:cell division protein FtsI/penicillin-binding protein 2